MPGHGAQISSRAPTQGYVEAGARAQAPGTGTKSEQGLSLSILTFLQAVVEFQSNSIRSYRYKQINLQILIESIKLM